MADLEVVPADSLVPYPGNPRRGDLERVRESIRENGFFGALVVRRSTREILVGNHRFRAGRAEGMTEFPVSWVDVDDNRARKILLADNRTGDLGKYDQHALDAILQEVMAAAGGDVTAALAGTGYVSLDVDKLVAETAALLPPPVEPGAAPPAPPPVKAKAPEREPVPAAGNAGTLSDVLVGDARWCVVTGDNVEKMRALPDGCVDAVVTDPPAGIAFMAKGWDSDKGGRDAWIAWLGTVMAECFRVLRPGGHALVWAIPRTSHWTMMALENAGFEIRDIVHHMFGQGFPKSLNVGKAIDREAGATRPVVGARTFTGSAALSTAEKGGTYASGTESAGARRDVAVTGPATPEAARWDGWGTALKPAVEPWILVRKPFPGTVAENVLAHGTGALNIDGCRVGTGGDKGVWPVTDREKTDENLGPKAPVLTDQAKGRFPAHLVVSHNEDCRKVGTRQVPTGTTYEPTGERDQDHWDRAAPISPSKMLGRITGYADADGMETVDAWECSEGCAVAMLDAQSGVASRFFAVFDGREDGSSTTINACGNANTRAASTSAGRSTVGSEGSSRTGGFGSMSGGPFPLDGTSTTETATLSITMSKTSSACPPNSIETTTDESGKTTPSPTELNADDASGARNTGRSNHSRTGQRGRSKGTASTASETHCGSGEQRIASVITPTCGNTEGVERPSPRFFYTPKASRSDREEGLGDIAPRQRDETREPGTAGADNPRNRGGKMRANFHPTVKPTGLMRWLVRLITPPGGVVLDAFTGSGSTGKAAMLEGARFIGFEQDADYANLARHRIQYADTKEPDDAE